MSELFLHVTRGGEIVAGGRDPDGDRLVDLAGLPVELDRAGTAGQTVVFSRDDPESDPSATALAVLRALLSRGLSVQLVSAPDRPPLDPRRGVCGPPPWLD